MNLARFGLVALLLAVNPARAEAPSDSPTEPAASRISDLLALQGRGEQAKTAFRKALADPRGAVRSAAIQLLAKEAGPAAVADLAPLIEDSDENVAGAAAIALVEIGGEATREPILKALASPSPRVRGQTLAYLGDRKDDRFVDEMSKLLSDDVGYVRANVVAAYEAMLSPKSFPYVMAATTDADHEIVLGAIRTLGGLRDPRAHDRLARLRASDSPEIRAAVAGALVATDGFASQREALEALAGDKDRSVRMSLVVFLRDYPSPRAIPLLAKLVEDGDALVRRGVVQALKAIDVPATLPILAKMLGDADSNVRAVAATGIAQRKAVTYRPAVAKLVDDPAERVRAAVAIALGDLGGDESYPALKRLVADESSIVRGRAVDAAARIGTDGAFPIVEIALADGDPLVRLEAVRALGVLPAGKSLPRLRELTRAEDLQIRIAAVQQLGARKDKGAVEPLRALQKEPVEAVRAAARSALTAIESD